MFDAKGNVIQHKEWGWYTLSLLSGFLVAWILTFACFELITSKTEHYHGAIYYRVSSRLLC